MLSLLLPQWKIRQQWRLARALWRFFWAERCCETLLFIALRKTKTKNSGVRGGAPRSRNTLQPILEEDGQLPYDNAPISDGHRPFATDFHDGKYTVFSRLIICWVDRFRLGKLP